MPHSSRVFSLSSYTILFGPSTYTMIYENLLVVALIESMFKSEYASKLHSPFYVRKSMKSYISSTWSSLLNLLDTLSPVTGSLKFKLIQLAYESAGSVGKFTSIGTKTGSLFFSSSYLSD